MFGKKKEDKIRSTRVSTVIGQGTQVNGDVVFSGGLHVDGTVKGNVRADDGADAILSLSELGIIEGEVHVPIIILNGAVQGNVFASEQIELAAKSKVTGDVSYKLIEMAVGAEVNGRLLHQEDAVNKLVSATPDMPKNSSNPTDMPKKSSDMPKKNSNSTDIPKKGPNPTAKDAGGAFAVES